MMKLAKSRHRCPPLSVVILLFSLLLVLQLPSCDALGVNLYQHCWYGGWNRRFGVGRWHTSHFRNDDASSIRVDSNTRARCMEHQCGGRVVTYGPGSHACMVWQGFNDRLSCMDVEPITVTCGAGKWRNGCCSCPNCPSGRYRSSSGGVGEGSCSHCPAGRYGSGAGLTSSNCNGACAAGYYCTTGSTTATQNQCSPGRYSTGGAGSSACSGLCPAGRYCPAGSTSTSRLCNAGRYGNAGAASAECSGPCPAGYYCPSGTGTPTSNPCGEARYFCPTGSQVRQQAPAGKFTEGGTNPQTRTQAVSCPAGYYCPGDGLRYPCPLGRYGSTTGLSTRMCSGLCAAGYLCEEGSVRATQAQCADTSKEPSESYCPINREANWGFGRSTVDPDHYTVPEGEAQENHRTGQVPCAADEICIKGRRFERVAWAAECASPDSAVRRFVAAENQPAGQHVGTLSAVSNEQPARELTYSVMSQEPVLPSCDLEPITVDPATGELTVDTEVDFESCSGWRVAVEVTDGTNTRDCSLLIAVANANDPPQFDGTFAFAIEEGSSVGATVGTPVRAIDSDVGDELSFSITGGNDAGFFRIGSCSGQMVVAASGLDFEDTPSFELEVSVRDSGSPPLSVSTTVNVEVTNKNEPPSFDRVDYGFFVEERKAGAVAGVATASDPDGDDLFYTITRNEDGAFAIDPTSGELKLAPGVILDYESKHLYSIELEVTDLELAVRQSFIARVTDVNDPPVLEDFSGGLDIQEDSPAGTPVGEALQGSDEDSGTTLTYSIEGGSGASLFVIDAPSGQVSVAPGAVVDYETAAEYTLIVRVTDDGVAASNEDVLFAEVTARVVVLDINEAPVIVGLSLSVPEDAPMNRVLAPAPSFEDAEVDAGRQILSWQIVEDEQSGSAELEAAPTLFRLDTTTGAVVVASQLDAETLDRAELRVRAIDSGSPMLSSNVETFVISIENVNEAPSVVQGITGFVDENADAGTVLSGRDNDAGSTVPMRCTDPDVGGMDGMTYGVVQPTEGHESDFEGWFADPNGSGNYLPMFAVDAETGAVSVASAEASARLDYETLNNYALQVTCIDSGGLSAEGMYVISLLDLNEPPDFPATTLSLPERSPAGSNVGAPLSFVVSDQDYGQGGYLFYQIESQPDGELYSLNATSGQLSINVVSPLHTAPDDSLVIRVTDSGGLFTDGSVTVEHIDGNIAPIMSDVHINVPESTPHGTVLTDDLGATDEDFNQTLTYSIIAASPIGSATLFNLDAPTGALALAGQLDFEHRSQYRLTVRVVDNGPGQLSTSADVYINVLDVPEAPIVTVPDVDAVQVPENTAPGTFVVNATAVDSDSADRVPGALLLTLEYSDPAEAATGVPPFSIGVTTGVITVADGAVLDFESRSSYDVIVWVTDTSGLTGNVSFTVSVIDLNEQVTVESAEVSLKEDEDPGIVLGVMRAADPDAGSSIQFSIVDGNFGSAFAIDATTGAVSLAEPLDFEARSSYVLTVFVTDNGPGQPTNATATVSVVVENVNDLQVLSIRGEVLHSTRGGDEIIFVGENMGPTGDNVGDSGQDAVIEATYGPTGMEYEAVDCHVLTTNTEIACTTVPGVGAGLLWTLIVNHGEGRVVASSFPTHYLPPSIAAVDVLSTDGLASTGGGDVVIVTGSNFGPPGSRVDAALYGQSLQFDASRGCAVTAPPEDFQGQNLQSVVRCLSVPGVGANHEWSVTIAGQTSQWSGVGSVMSYRAPTVGAALGSDLSTSGGSHVQLLGTDFGPVPSATFTDAQNAALGLTAWIGASGVDQTLWYPAACEVIALEESGHGSANCTVSEGVGGDLLWRVEVGGQASGVDPGDPTAPRSSYRRPRIVEVTGEGASGSSTLGGGRILLKGQDFGPPATHDITVDAEGATVDNAVIRRPDGVATYVPWPHAKYGPQGSEISALNCRVVKSHTEIECLTNEGTGYGHSWQVVVGGQASSVMLPAVSGELGTSYAPPTVAFFTGAGAEAAHTTGGQDVVINGTNFGKHTSKIDAVWYFMEPNDAHGSGGATVFAAADCEILVPHVNIRCLTAPGVGKNLEWTVMIDGQNSSVPVTAYAEPVVRDIVAEHLSDLSANGGDDVWLVGDHFGPPHRGFVTPTSVTYGPTGTEVHGIHVQHHNHIPGVGQGHSVRVRVGNQESDASEATLSYALPSIANVAPSHGGTDGGTIVRVEGYNFGLISGASIGVQFGSAADSTISSELLDVRNAYPRSRALPDGTSARTLVESFEFEVPPGLGLQRGIAVVSNSIALSSTVVGEPVTFDYDDPDLQFALINASVPGLPGMVELTAFGSNFGPPRHPRYADSVVRQVLIRERAADGSVPDGAAFVDAGVSIISWTHNRVVARTSVRKGDIRLAIGSWSVHAGPGSDIQWQQSRSFFFADSAPTLSERVGDQLAQLPAFNTEGWLPMTRPGTPQWDERVLQVPLLNLKGAQTLSVNVSNVPCPILDEFGDLVPDGALVDYLDFLEPTYYDNDEQIINEATEWTIQCALPPGEGRDNMVSIERNGEVGGNFVIHYQMPELVTPEVLPLTSPTRGRELVLRGKNFGLWPVLLVGSATVRAIGDPRAPATQQHWFTSHAHTELTFHVPPGEGTGVSYAGPDGWTLELLYPQNLGSTPPLPFRYDPPTVAHVTSPSAGTAGGELVTVIGDNFGSGNLGQLPRVFFGTPDIGWECTSVVISRAHEELQCLSPPGQGADIRLYVQVSEQVAVGGSFSYDAPVVHSIEPGPHAAADLLSAEVVDGVVRGDTAGGYNITLRGSNFGRPDAVAGQVRCVFASWHALDAESRRCNDREDVLGEGEIPSVHVLEASHDTIVFQVPPGMGSKSVVVAAAAQSSEPVRFVYHAPQLESMTPESADTEGGQIIVLRGANFGATPGLPWDLAPSEALPAGVVAPHDGETAHSYTGALVNADGMATLPEIPPLQALRIDFYVEQFSRCLTGATEVIPPLDDCDRVGKFRRSSESRDLVDRRFVMLHSHDTIVFRVPGGIGVNRNVRIGLFDLNDYASDQLGSRFLTEPLSFSYNPPRVQYVSPNAMDALGANLIIGGENFGRSADLITAFDYERSVHIEVDGQPCRNAERVERLSFVTLVCDADETLVGYKNLSISVAGQNATLLAPDERFYAVCDDAWFGQVGEYCLPCPRGAVCDGDVRIELPAPQAEPKAIEGWFNLNGSCDSVHVGPALERRKHRSHCNLVVPCEPKQACAGNNECSDGYISVEPIYRCAQCAPRYYRRAGFCVECPDNALLLIVFFLAGAIALAFTGFFLNRANVNLAFVSIGVDYFQVLALFANSRVQWPQLLRDVFHILSAFNLNLELTAPECSIPDISYEQKWYFIMLLPVAVALVLILAHGVVLFKKLCVQGRGRASKTLHRHTGTMIATYIVMMYFLYLYLTRTTLDVWNCAPTDPPDGHEYLEVVFEECWLPGGLQLRLLVPSLVTMLVYVVGFPAFVWWKLWRNKLLVYEDQLLRAKGTGNSRKENPNAYELRKAFSKVYFHFKPDKWYWILVVIARKFGVAFTALMFNRNPAFQLSVALLVMFVAYALQVRHVPFMSPSERGDVLTAHRMAAATGDPIHAALKEQMDRVADRNKRGPKKVGWAHAKTKAEKAAVARAAAANFLYNYNTVESMLLACAVVVNLAGVMFESGRFESEYYQEQRDAVTFLVMIVIIASIIYWCVVFISEVAATLRASRAAKRVKEAGKAKASSGRFGADGTESFGKAKLKSAVKRLSLVRTMGGSSRNLEMNPLGQSSPPTEQKRAAQHGSPTRSGLAGARSASLRDITAMMGAAEEPTMADANPMFLKREEARNAARSNSGSGSSLVLESGDVQVLLRENEQLKKELQTARSERAKMQAQLQRAQVSAEPTRRGLKSISRRVKKAFTPTRSIHDADEEDAADARAGAAGEAAATPAAAAGPTEKKRRRRRRSDKPSSRRDPVTGKKIRRRDKSKDRSGGEAAE